MVSDLYSAVSLASDLGAISDAINRVQNQLATGLRVQAPSDDPAAWQQNELLSADAAQISTRATIASNVMGVLDAAQNAASSASSVLTQALALAQQNANGTVTAAQMKAAASSAQGFLTDLVAAANTTFSNAYIFGGTANRNAPYDSAGNYSGASGANNVALAPNAQVPVNFVGSQVFGFAPNSTYPAGSGAIAAVAGLITALQAGNQAAVAAAIPQLQNAIHGVAQFVAQLGGLQQLAQDQKTEAKGILSSLQDTSSTLVDTNLASAATDLALFELQQQALVSLASGFARRPLVNILA